MKIPKIQETGSGPVLHCPQCNGNYLHLDSVDTYIRDRENSDTGTHVKVSGHEIETNNSMYGNPCSSRDGVTMSFWCEYCMTRSFLSLGNRKGETQMAWFHGYQDQI